MKQLKIVKPENKSESRPSRSPKTASNTTRQEVDAAIKTLVSVIEKDPKKAARIFESWIGSSGKSQPKKAA